MAHQVPRFLQLIIQYAAMRPMSVGDELYKYVLGCQDVNIDSTKDMRS